jgi:transcriptional regulator with XRE-family HTH domain
MAVPFDHVKAKLAPEIAEEGERMGKELIAQYLTLRELRKARKLSQKDLAARFNTKQSEVSKIEKRQDLRLSTIRGYVEAAGGTLEIRVLFPHLPSVIVDFSGSGAKKPRKIAVDRSSSRRKLEKKS